MANNLNFLTKNFTWAEAVITNHREIDNEINKPEIFNNIIQTAGKLEKVRALFGIPLIISSWYRCAALNAAVGGTKNSDHLIGAAVDFIAPHYGIPLDIAKKIQDFKEIIGFKQLILEHTWIHVSWDMIPDVIPKLEVLSLLSGGGYAKGLVSKDGTPLL